MEKSVKVESNANKPTRSHKKVEAMPPAEGSNNDQPANAIDQKQQTQQPQQKLKRKHRRGKPKAKNGNKPYKKTNWRFQMPRLAYSKSASAGGSGGLNRREKLQRSRSLVPYNTNKFLMEEHLSEVPCNLLTPSGRTRDSSFSMDSEDNYFFSLPEDEEEFLTKEFANVYEKARVERLESLTKQQLIEECLQIEDRYSKDQGNQRLQQLNIQRVSQDYMSRIRMLDEKVKELSRENLNLRCQLMRSAAFAAVAAASPPSAAAPMGAACQPTPMDSSSEDSESDSSTSSSSSSSSTSSSSNGRNQVRRRRSGSSHSSLSEYNAYNENNMYIQNQQEERDGVLGNIRPQPRLQPATMENINGEDFERRHLLVDHMLDEDYVDSDDEHDSNPKINGYHAELSQQQNEHGPNENNSSLQHVTNDDFRGNTNVAERSQNIFN